MYSINAALYMCENCCTMYMRCSPAAWHYISLAVSHLVHAWQFSHVYEVWKLLHVNLYIDSWAFSLLLTRRPPLFLILLPSSSTDCSAELWGNLCIFHISAPSLFLTSCIHYFFMFSKDVWGKWQPWWKPTSSILVGWIPCWGSDHRWCSQSSYGAHAVHHGKSSKRCYWSSIQSEEAHQEATRGSTSKTSEWLFLRKSSLSFQYFSPKISYV